MYGFRFYFTPLCRVLFTFPSRYLFTIGHLRVFSLGRWCCQIQTGFLRSRPTQDTTVLAYLYGTITLYGAAFQRSSCSLRAVWSYNPALALTNTVWANPLSLATTQGITIVFSSSGYLDVSVPQVRLFRLLGCPIRKSSDL